MDISIVIPAYNESTKIRADIEAAARSVKANNLTGEIIVVDDGSADSTARIAKETQVPEQVKLKVMRFEQNRGKGFAIRMGMAQTCGEFVMFADCGCCVPYEHILDGLKLIKNSNCDIAHASRKHMHTRIKRHQNLYRRLCSMAFRLVMRYYMKMPRKLTDSQCGFKVYRGNVARELYSECFTDGFMFDIEVIMRAKKKGYTIKEFPIEWTCDRDSRLSPSRNLFSVLSELANIKRKVGH